MKRQHPTDQNLFWCAKCKTYLPSDEYRLRENGYLAGWCKKCFSKAAVKYCKEHPEKYKWAAKNRESVSDWYVRRDILKDDNASPEMIELVRQRIIMKRTLSEFKKWRKANESNYADVYGKQCTNEENHEGRVQA